MSSRAIVPYVGGSLLRRQARSASRRNLYARGAIRVGTFAWNNRATIRKLAINMRRRWRGGRIRIRKRSTIRGQIGYRPGSGTSRRVQTGTESDGLRDTRTLYSSNLTDISGGTDLNDKSRGIIYISGFKICFQAQVESTVVPAGKHLLLNFAVVAPKINQDSIETADFFRGNASQRGVAFSTQLSSTDIHCLNINTDRYRILTHARYKLGRENGDRAPNHLFLQRWIPLRRQIRFDTSTNVAPSDNIYMIYWTDISNTGANTAVSASAWRLSYHAITYFRNQP